MYKNLTYFYLYILAELKTNIRMAREALSEFKVEILVQFACEEATVHSLALHMCTKQLLLQLSYSMEIRISSFFASECLFLMK